jgi:rod shape determining protein RodA
VKLRFVSQFDYVIFFAALLLIILGVAFIYSSGVDSSGVSVSTEYVRQIVFACTGLLLLAAAAFADFRKISRYALYLYFGLLAVLVYTFLFGRYVNGARSWLGIGSFGVQPSEFGKVIFIIFLARHLEHSSQWPPFRRFLTSLGIMLLPMCLILLQPDLGTASVYLPVFLIMCFMAGIPLRYIFLVLFGGMLTVVFAVLPIWESEIYQKTLGIIRVFQSDSLRLIVIAAGGAVAVVSLVGFIRFKNRYYFWLVYVFGILTFALVASKAVNYVLKDYQIKRLIVFLNPDSDPLGAGWNIIQSKIAIGSGNFFGQGFLRGTQSHYHFLPQQNTDFIFSILSEEWGFIGGMIVYALYFVILTRILAIIKNTPHVFGAYIASGIFGMFFFHFIVNVGMVMGLMPITGIPLLFLSYGGSSLWTAMICVGLLMGIYARRLEISNITL